MEDVLVVEGGAKTPSEHRRGTLEQGTESGKAHVEPWMSWRLIHGVPLCLPYATGIGSRTLLVTPKVK